MQGRLSACGVPAVEQVGMIIAMIVVGMRRYDYRCEQR